MNRPIDMSHTLVPGSAGRKLEIETVGADQVNPNVVRLENQWYVMHNVRMVNHLGTHIEMPYHLMKDGKDLATVPLDRLCGEAVVLDLRGLPERSAIAVEDVQRAASEAGGIRPDDIVLCNLGYGAHYGTPRYDEKPYFSNESLVWLVSAGMKLMAVDASGVEIPGSEEHVNHMALLAKGVPLIENLTGFDRLSRPRVLFYAFPIAVAGLDSFPVRAVAFELQPD